MTSRASRSSPWPFNTGSSSVPRTVAEQVEDALLDLDAGEEQTGPGRREGALDLQVEGRWSIRPFEAEAAGGEQLALASSARRCRASGSPPGRATDPEPPARRWRWCDPGTACADRRGGAGRAIPSRKIGGEAERAEEGAFDVRRLPRRSEPGQRAERVAAHVERQIGPLGCRGGRRRRRRPGRGASRWPGATGRPRRGAPARCRFRSLRDRPLPVADCAGQRQAAAETRTVASGRSTVPPTTAATDMRPVSRPPRASRKGVRRQSDSCGASSVK